MMSEAIADLAWLAERGALAGVAGIIAERRRQIEQLGYGLEYDRQENSGGDLADMTADRADQCVGERMAGLSNPARDEVILTCAGALAAAEIDRLLSQS